MATDEVIARLWAEFGGRVIRRLFPDSIGWWVEWRDGAVDGFWFVYIYKGNKT